MSDHSVLVVPRSHDSFLAGLKLYRKRPDKEYSLTDCISMYTMRLYGLNEALTRGSSAAQFDLFLASGEPVYRRDGDLCILEADRTEMANLAMKHPDRVKSMSAAYDAWAKRANVMPFDEVRKGRRPPASS